MTPQQTLTFWRLAVGNATSIPPTAIFNDEFERGLFKENPSGEWRLSKRHPDYRAYWCEAFDYCARLRAHYECKVCGQYLCTSCK